MKTAAPTQFVPDYAVHPGEILEEHLEARGMKKGDFAERCNISPKTVSLIVGGHSPVTPENAIHFERVLGVSAVIWNNLDAGYRLHEARLREQDELAKSRKWVGQFPIAELVKRGYLEHSADPVEQVKALLDFFGVANQSAYEQRYSRLAISYRQSPAFQSDPDALAVWLRMGEVKAEGVDTEPYNRERFKRAVEKIRSLTTNDPIAFEPEMKELCRQSGVALAFVSELPGTHLSGATKWLTSEKALIIQSLRHKKDDHFWFTFFHEAAHILKHGKKDVFIDDRGIEETDKEEEANQFAANLLIPPQQYREFVRRPGIYKPDIRAFADSIGIAPGIVVGRLQHDGHIKQSWHNDLKRTFKLVGE